MGASAAEHLETSHERACRHWLQHAQHVARVTWDETSTTFMQLITDNIFRVKKYYLAQVCKPFLWSI